MITKHIAVKHPSFFIKEKTGLAKFNNILATKLGSILGSMSFFYFCLLLDIAELPAVMKVNSAIAWITYASQTVIQLLALPILQVYQNILQEHNDAKATADHIALTHIATQVDKLLKNKQ